MDTWDIQGNILPGFDTDHHALLFMEIREPAAARSWLGAIGAEITSLGDMLAHERRPGGGAASPRTWINIAFSHVGLQKLYADAEAIMDVPFKEGMAKHSRLLGDPIEPDADGFVENWVIGGPHNVPDVLLLLADDDRDRLAARVAQIGDDLPAGVTVMFTDFGSKLHGPTAAREHFGFRDPISQPGVRGRLSADPDDFLTRRENPANPHQGKPGQNLVWPGEFVLGYPGQDAMDIAKPGLVARAGPSWTRNGSFLVFRRLRQDVAAYREYLATAAAELSRTVGLDLTPEQLSAKFVGRWPSGTPIVHSPDLDRPELAADASTVNDFMYVEATPATSAAGNGHNGSRQSAGDELGLICPHAAHIRKAYPRDHATSIDTVSSMETHRILRRGVPYGEPFPAPGERGLLFLAYQTSIERQFEFITRAWLNNPNLRSGIDGHDPIAGQRSYAVKGDRTRTFKLPYQNGDGTVERATIKIPKDWVIPTGGGYFFVPSISALQDLAR